LSKNCLVFGGSGAIGSAIVELFKSLDFSVWTTTRSTVSVDNQVVQITGNSKVDLTVIQELPVMDVIVWAQGVNLNDSILDLKTEDLREVLEANTVFIASTMNSLVSSGRAISGTRMCVISSIWQELIRKNKLSYSISKAALGALVKSSAIDLAVKGIFVNAVLPGVLDTPMTNSVLNQQQLTDIKESTGFGRLVTPEEIAQVVHFLCSDSNLGISGQSIVVDLGFSNAKQI
jgi:3-oxoacyl-[acyl-carrier protein] reductase